MALSSGGLLQIGECLLGVRMEVTVAYTCVRKNYVVGWLILRFVFMSDRSGSHTAIKSGHACSERADTHQQL